MNSKREGRDVWYEDCDFDQALKATGKQLKQKAVRQFKERLEEIATAFIQEFGLQERDTPSDIVKRLDTIASKAKTLVQLTRLPQAASAATRLHAQATHYRRIRVRTLSINARSELQEHIEACQYPTVEDAIKAVKALALYAKQAAERERPKKKARTDKNRNKGNAARQKFINNLAGLWFDTFEEFPGGSVKTDTQKRNGPFIRFAIACYAPLRRQFPLPTLSDNAAREHYKKTDEARLKGLIKKSNQK